MQMQIVLLTSFIPKSCQELLNTYRNILEMTNAHLKIFNNLLKIKRVNRDKVALGKNKKLINY